MLRRAQVIQRHILYAEDPNGLVGELARWRAVSIVAGVTARAAWLGPERMVEVETVPG
jgi:hypothetical protein